MSALTIIYQLNLCLKKTDIVEIIIFHLNGFFYM